jgi:hypothetical protein
VSLEAGTVKEGKERRTPVRAPTLSEDLVSSVWLLAGSAEIKLVIVAVVALKVWNARENTEVEAARAARAGVPMRPQKDVSTMERKGSERVERRAGMARAIVVRAHTSWMLLP